MQICYSYLYDLLQQWSSLAAKTKMKATIIKGNIYLFFLAFEYF